MSDIPSHTTTFTRKRHDRPYRQWTVEALAELIVAQAEAQAIHEVCDHRYLCQFAGSPPLRPPEYLLALNDSPRIHMLFRGNPEGRKYAYDQTIDLLWRVPANGCDGRDCRKLYSMFLHNLHRARAGESGTERIGPADPLSAEIEEAQVFQRCLSLNHYFACREALRGFDPSRSRYLWSCRGGQLTVWLPKHVTGEARARFLTRLVPDVNAARPGERERVQAMIDAVFPRAKALPLDEIGAGMGEPAAPMPDLGRLIQLDGLEETLAREKAMNLSGLRPSIRALGAPAVYQIVLCFLENRLTRKYTQKELARRFGCSPSAASHFAGDQWRLQSGGPPSDLYANLAELLASVEVFVEAVKAAGMWDRVQQTLDLIPLRKRKGAGHDR
jgi:hypothetical protein